MPKKSAFMVCSTFRNPSNLSILRYYGIVRLVEEAKTQDFDGTIKLAIVDSSPTPHPFFTSPETLLKEHGIVYLHVPDKNDDASWRQQFQMASCFIPSNDTVNNDSYWQEQREQMKGWDYFLPFEEEFRQIYKGPKPSDFITFDRPAIGMKKNAGIAALSEHFGPADYIIFCDDDDAHHKSYISTVATELDHNSFVRLTKWLTLVLGSSREEDRWGHYDIPFFQDRNGNWQIPEQNLGDVFNTSAKDGNGAEFKNAVTKKFSRPLMLAFPPISHDGALHSYRYDTWKNAADKFGGCAPTSFCEDMLFYRLCQKHLPEFSAIGLQPQQDLFIRCSDGTNASLIEWNRELKSIDNSAWARQSAREIAQTLEFGINDAVMAKAGKEFLRTGKINWDLFKTERSSPLSSVKPHL